MPKILKAKVVHSVKKRILQLGTEIREAQGSDAARFIVMRAEAIKEVEGFLKILKVTKKFDGLDWPNRYDLTREGNMEAPGLQRKLEQAQKDLRILEAIADETIDVRDKSDWFDYL